MAAIGQPSHTGDVVEVIAQLHAAIRLKRQHLTGSDVDAGVRPRLIAIDAYERPARPGDARRLVLAGELSEAQTVVVVDVEPVERDGGTVPLTQFDPAVVVRVEKLETLLAAGS